MEMEELYGQVSLQGRSLEEQEQIELILQEASGWGLKWEVELFAKKFIFEGDTEDEERVEDKPFTGRSRERGRFYGTIRNKSGQWKEGARMDSQLYPDGIRCGRHHGGSRTRPARF